MRATVYVATSLDGFIAREDGAIDWLSGGDGMGPSEDYGYQAFFDSVDALVIGRKTYDLVRSFGGAWPYGTKPVTVLTHRPVEIPESIAGTVEAIAASPIEVVRHLADRGAGHLYVDGGKTVQEFLAAGLIDRLILTRIPILIGSGIPLFGPVPGDIRLRHIETRSYPSGLVQSEYEVLASTRQSAPDEDASTPPLLSGREPRMKSTRSVLLVGATGLVGSECLRLLLADPGFGQVVVLTRRPLPRTWSGPGSTSKPEEHVVDFDRLESYAELFRVDEIICALGSTIKKAGSKERFRTIDYGYPLAIARMGVEHGAEHFLLVSAVGANARSRLFYNRVKGETEDAITALPYRSVTIVRPSLLLGEREEFRLGEEIGKRLSFLLPGPYKPVRADAVAAVLVQAARKNEPGRHTVESSRIRYLAERSE